jgi:predicted glutamine amidotransferase
LCGILGFITDRASKENIKYFKKILYMSEARGREATGIFYTKDDAYVIEKQPIISSKFIQDIFPVHANNLGRARIALGHTRSPTQGSPKDNSNNHPLESKNWILIHNGGVTLMPRLNDYKYKGEVDSEVLLSYIEKYGLKEGLPYVERGSAAVALIQKNDLNSVYLWRETNPIILACDTKSNTIFFASQKEFLESGLANRFLFFTSFQLRELPENLLIKITANPFTITPMGYIEVMKYDYTRYVSPIIEKYKPKSIPLVFNQSNFRWELPSQPLSKPPAIITTDGQKEKCTFLNTDGKCFKGYTTPCPENKYDCDYFGADLNTDKLHSGEPEHNINKYYIDGISRDFKNWFKLPKPNKGHISMDGVLFKKWDDVKKKHYIMLVEDAIKEKLIDETLLIEDEDSLDLPSKMIPYYTNMEME